MAVVKLSLLEGDPKSDIEVVLAHLLTTLEVQTDTNK